MKKKAVSSTFGAHLYRTISVLQGGGCGVTCNRIRPYPWDGLEVRRILDKRHAAADNQLEEELAKDEEKGIEAKQREHWGSRACKPSPDISS